MKPLEQADLLWQVVAWRALTVLSALLLGAVVSALVGQGDVLGETLGGELAGYLTVDALLTLALRPMIAHLGPRALSLHMALAVSWMAGAFFLAQLL